MALTSDEARRRAARTRQRTFSLDRTRLALPDDELAAFTREAWRHLPDSLRHKAGPACGSVANAIASPAGTGRPALGSIDLSVTGIEHALSALEHALDHALEHAGDSAPAQASELERQLRSLL